MYPKNVWWQAYKRPGSPKELSVTDERGKRVVRGKMPYYDNGGDESNAGVFSWYNDRQSIRAIFLLLWWKLIPRYCFIFQEKYYVNSVSNVFCDTVRVLKLPRHYSSVSNMELIIHNEPKH
jgi:hypothetical protein